MQRFSCKGIVCKQTTSWAVHAVNQNACHAAVKDVILQHPDKSSAYRYHNTPALPRQKDVHFYCFKSVRRNVLIIAVRNNFTYTAQCLLKNRTVCVNSMDIKNNLPLHYAVKNNNLVLVDKLLQVGSDINTLNKQFESPLHISVRLGHLQILERLVSQGCNVNICEPNFNVTPLHLAVTLYENFEDFKEVFYLLLKGKCAINIRAFSTLETPVYRAIDMNKTKIAELLLVHGADPNLGCPFDVTALQKACERCNPHLVNMILHCGVNWKKERWLKKFVTGRNVTCNSEINECLYCWRTKVMDLQHLTRLTIRKNLYENLSEKLKSLHIPQKLKDYILLSDARSHNFDMG